MIHEWKIEGRHINLSTEALNALTNHAFKRPRPHGTPSMLETEDGKQPGISFTDSMRYLYSFCLDHLSKQFIDTLGVVYRKSGRLTYPKIEDMPCGDHVASKLIHIHYWDIQCALVCVRGDLTYGDVQALFQSTDNISEYFILEIVAAVIRPRREDPVPDRALPKGYSKNDLERNGNRSKHQNKYDRRDD